MLRLSRFGITLYHAQPVNAIAAQSLPHWQGMIQRFNEKSKRFRSAV